MIAGQKHEDCSRGYCKPMQVVRINVEAANNSVEAAKNSVEITRMC